MGDRLDNHHARVVSLSAGGRSRRPPHRASPGDLSGVFLAFPDIVPLVPKIPSARLAATGSDTSRLSSLLHTRISSDCTSTRRGGERIGVPDAPSHLPRPQNLVPSKKELAHREERPLAAPADETYRQDREGYSAWSDLITPQPCRHHSARNGQTKKAPGNSPGPLSH